MKRRARLEPGLKRLTNLTIRPRPGSTFHAMPDLPGPQPSLGNAEISARVAEEALKNKFVCKGKNDDS